MGSRCTAPDGTEPGQYNASGVQEVMSFEELASANRMNHKHGGGSSLYNCCAADDAEYVEHEPGGFRVAIGQPSAAHPPGGVRTAAQHTDAGDQSAPMPLEMDPTLNPELSQYVLATMAINIERQLEMQDHMISKLLEDSDAEEARLRAEGKLPDYALRNGDSDSVAAPVQSPFAPAPDAVPHSQAQPTVADGGAIGGSAEGAVNVGA